MARASCHLLFQIADAKAAEDGLQLFTLRISERARIFRLGTGAPFQLDLPVQQALKTQASAGHLWRGSSADAPAGWKPVVALMAGEANFTHGFAEDVGRNICNFLKHCPHPAFAICARHA